MKHNNKLIIFHQRMKTLTMITIKEAIIMVEHQSSEIISIRLPAEVQIV